MNIKIKVAFILIAVLVSFSPYKVIAQTDPNAITQDAVRFYFADVPIMIDVARCETTFRQYNFDGTPYYDRTHTYVGVFQIAESIHSAKALGMGFDIRTLDGNLQYARYLYNASGTNPWKGCLPKQVTPVPAVLVPPAPTPVPTNAPTPAPVAPTISGSLTMNLNFGMNNSQVLILQQLLNKNGFIITDSGGGSVGQETTKFGSLTREAVKKFQCAKQIVCAGSESTSGYGRVGPQTRNALNRLIDTN